MKPDEQEVVVPVLREEAVADAMPVQTGGVRVTKHVQQHDEIVEQELRKGHVEVKRIQMNRVVDGPQPAHKSGNTLIVPVVSEVLKVEKQWVVTEEIHITQLEETEAFRQRVQVKEEQALVERLDESGAAISEIDKTPPVSTATRTRPASLVDRNQQPAGPAKDRVLATQKSILRKRPGTS